MKILVKMNLLVFSQNKLIYYIEVKIIVLIKIWNWLVVFRENQLTKSKLFCIILSRSLLNHSTLVYRYILSYIYSYYYHELLSVFSSTL